jgi:hypothetical protein
MLQIVTLASNPSYCRPKTHKTPQSIANHRDEAASEDGNPSLLLLSLALSFFFTSFFFFLGQIGQKRRRVIKRRKNGLKIRPPSIGRTMDGLWTDLSFEKN